MISCFFLFLYHVYTPMFVTLLLFQLYKAVPMSRTRVLGITWSDTGLEVDVMGVPDESVHFGLCLPNQDDLTVVQCVIGVVPRARIVCSIIACTCSGGF